MSVVIACSLKISHLCRTWGSHSCGYEEFYLLGYNAVQRVKNLPTFRRNISPPSLESKNKPSSACHMFSRLFLARLILLSWRWRRHVPPKRWLTFNGLHGVISQKIELLILHVLTKYENEYFPRNKMIFVTLSEVTGMETYKPGIRSHKQRKLGWKRRTKIP
jgi:hypothetical protein